MCDRGYSNVPETIWKTVLLKPESYGIFPVLFLFFDPSFSKIMCVEFGFFNISDVMLKAIFLCPAFFQFWYNVIHCKSAYENLSSDIAVIYPNTC